MKFAPFQLATTPLEPGTILLEASAGTGKTYTLVGILLRLLVEGRIERLDQALVVTFTVAATEELKNRLRSALRLALAAAERPGKDRFLNELAARPGAATKFAAALAGFDQVAISTIHGFCKRLLDETAFECHSPFTLEFTPDPLPLLQRAAADALRLQYAPGITARSALLAHGGFTPASLVEAFRLWRRHPDVALTPDPADLDTSLAGLDTALRACADAGTVAAIGDVAGVEWRKGKSPFGDDLVAELARLHERLHHTPASVLETLLALAPRQRGKRHNVGTARLYDRPLFVACEQLADAVEDAIPHLRATLLRAMHERVELGKRGDGVLTFDDLLLRAHTALKDPARRSTLLAALRERFTVGLIDEFQDTDTLQYQIFADCFAERTLFLIGDPKQAIYGFRGADLRAYLLARGDAVRRYTLTTNHRSAARLCDAVSQWFSANPRPFLDERIELPAIRAAATAGQLTLDGDGEAVLRVRYVPPTAGDWHNKPEAIALVAADVADEAVRLLSGRCRRDGEPLRPRDLAVLTRTNMQAVRVQEELRRRGIPSAIGKAGDIFLTDEVEELRRFLLAVLQPGDLRRVRAAMATRLWGLDATALIALEHEPLKFDEWLERIAQWRRLWLRHGFIVMQEQALVDLGAHTRYLGWTTGERRLTNFRQLFELLHEAEHTHRLSPEGLVEWLAHERENQEDLDYTLRELRLESDDDAAQILTVHGSKGLQYEVVFCPFLWDAMQPRQNADVATTATGHELLFSPQKHPSYPVLVRERLEEELRLAYVAMTRAKRRCYVHWGVLSKNASSSALAWLLHGTDTEPGKVDGKAKEDWLATWQKRTGDDRSNWLLRIERLAAQSAGAIDVTRIGDAASSLRRPPTTPAGLQQPRRPERRMLAHGLHSFSSLVARSHDAEPSPETEVERSPATSSATPPRGIFAFARGPVAGQCLHTILERIDLAGVAAPTTADVVRAVLEAEGMASPEAHSGAIDPVPDVHRALIDLARGEAFPGGPTLGALCGGRRAVEWQFTLPTPGTDVDALARVLAKAPGEAARRQARRLLSMPPQDLRGFLVGFVDLVAEHDGRWWVLDWKSNHLGNDAADYAAEHLLPAMVDHDYVLQYHLYVLALHRQLRVRVRGYDPERHLGGVVYAFLRGAVPGTACGMFFDRVPTAVVAALDGWLDGAREVTR